MTSQLEQAACPPAQTAICLQLLTKWLLDRLACGILCDRPGLVTATSSTPHAFALDGFDTSKVLGRDAGFTLAVAPLLFRSSGRSATCAATATSTAVSWSGSTRSERAHMRWCGPARLSDFVVLDVTCTVPRMVLRRRMSSHPQLRHVLIESTSQKQIAPASFHVLQPAFSRHSVCPPHLAFGLATSEDLVTRKSNNGHHHHNMPAILTRPCAGLAHDPPRSCSASTPTATGCSAPWR